MAHHSELLQRYKPSLQYDSQEAFFADAAEMMTDGKGCSLRQDGGKALFGGRGVPALALTVLRDIEYGENNPVADNDRICLAGKRYRSDYSRLRKERPELKNKVYGRAARGGDGRLWLQYWLFYVYNDYQLAARFGLHEGDWEMVTLRIDEQAAEPDLAVYAQHAYAEARPWGEVLKEDDGRPLVFVARGSHGSYFESGMFNTQVFYDIADGDRDTPELELVTLDGDEPAWPRWPGIWGATRARNVAESDSPTSPVRHPQWRDPAKVMKLVEKRPAGATRADPPQPGGTLGASRLGRRLVIEYEGDGGAVAVVATLNSPDEKGVPPRAFTFGVEGRTRGKQVVAYARLEPNFRYEVKLSLVDAERKPTASITVELPRAKPPIGSDLIGEVRLALHWIRDRVRGLFK